MRRLMILLPLIVFIGLVAVMGEMLTRDRNPNEIKSVILNKPAPKFSLPSLDGSFSVSDEILKGENAYVVNFWASWCIPCLAEHDFLTDMQKRGIPVLGIAFQDTLADSQAFLNRLGNPFVATVSDLDGRSSVEWGVYGVPETFIIDREGIVRYKHFGPITENRYDDFLAAYEEANGS